MYVIIHAPENKGISEFNRLYFYVTNCIKKDVDFKNNCYYVYRHYYIDKNTKKEITFYVGKGKGKRVISKNRNNIWINKVKLLIRKNINIEV